MSASNLDRYPFRKRVDPLTDSAIECIDRDCCSRVNILFEIAASNNKTEKPRFGGWLQYLSLGFSLSSVHISTHPDQNSGPSIIIDLLINLSFNIKVFTG